MHAQSVFWPAVTLRNLAWQAHYERTIVPTPDGGAFGLDWFRCREACEKLPESAPVLLVLHSITGQVFITCPWHSRCLLSNDFQ